MHARSIINLRGLVLLGSVYVSLACGASANFSGSDDFANASADWSPILTVGGGSFTVANGVLNFTTPSSPSTLYNELALRYWFANNGDYDSDWSLRLDVLISTPPVMSGDYAAFTLKVENEADHQDAVRVSFRQDGEARSRYANSDLNGVRQGEIFVGGPNAMSVSIGLSYNSASHTIAAGYDNDGPVGGYLYSHIKTFDIDAMGSDWEMISDNQFLASIYAESTFPISLGELTIDNFVAAPLRLPFRPLGDFDQDGVVNGADFLAWQRDPSIGNLSDWQANYGTIHPLASHASVPEPNTLIILVSAFACRLRWRRS